MLVVFYRIDVKCIMIGMVPEGLCMARHGLANQTLILQDHARILQDDG